MSMQSHIEPNEIEVLKSNTVLFMVHICFHMSCIEAIEVTESSIDLNDVSFYYFVYFNISQDFLISLI